MIQRCAVRLLGSTPVSVKTWTQLPKFIKPSCPLPHGPKELRHELFSSELDLAAPNVIYGHNGIYRFSDRDRWYEAEISMPAAVASCLVNVATDVKDTFRPIPKAWPKVSNEMEKETRHSALVHGAQITKYLTKTPENCSAIDIDQETQPPNEEKIMKKICIKNDLLQIVRGGLNVLVGIWDIVVNPLHCIAWHIDEARIGLKKIFSKKTYNQYKNTQERILFAIGKVAYQFFYCLLTLTITYPFCIVLPNALRILRGLTQIATYPFALLRIPLRLAITKLADLYAERKARRFVSVS